MRLVLFGLAGLLAALGLFLLYVLGRSSTLHLERTIAIAAPPGRVFALIDDLHQWPIWWKNERLDGPRQVTYSGAPRGVGAEVQSAGKALFTFRITKVVPDRQVELDVTGSTLATGYRLRFVVVPTATGCTVTVHMDRQLEYWEKLLDTVTRGLAPILGEGYERTLTELRRAAEAG